MPFRVPIAALAVLLASLGVASSAHAAVVINEIESNPNPDFVELHNTGPGTVNLANWDIVDAGGNVSTIAADPTDLAAGAYFQFPAPPGLGNPDSITLRDPADAVVDTYAWIDHAEATYGRCPDGTGAITATLAPTPGAANNCLAGVAAWPGGTSVQDADVQNALGTDISGLAYAPSGTVARGVLYAVRNDPSMIYRFVPNGTTWVADTTNGWANGKTLQYPLGNGAPDAEGVTIDPNDPGAVYVAAERDGGGASAPAVLRFDVSGAATTLPATDLWTLALPGLPANGGPEAITWVPDVDLVAKGFRDQTQNKVYAPGDYADHGTGLFFVGVEQDGSIRAYALNRQTDTASPVAVASNAYGAVMDLQYEAETKKIWAACDDTCDGRHSLLDVTAGDFVVTQTFNRPAGMPNYNNEGFAIAPQAECVDGYKPVIWADDEYTNGRALRTGTVNCTSPPVPMITPTPTPTPTPTVTATATPGPQDTTPPKLTNVTAKRKSIAFRLSEDADVAVTIERKKKGKPFKRAARFTVALDAGARTIRFKGRAPARVLKAGAGALRISLRATDAAGNSTARISRRVR